MRYALNRGRPSIPVRVLVGLLILKQLENLSDEAIVLQWKRNPYYQYFCGERSFQNKVPCHATELVHFLHRIGTKGVEKIFKRSVGLHGDAVEDKTVNIDTTVQEKNITYPTDGKLAIKIINRLNKLAIHQGIKQRRTDSNKIYSLHESQIYCVAKGKASAPAHAPYLRPVGKDHKPYEYGTKASIVATAGEGIILSAVSHSEISMTVKPLTKSLAKPMRFEKPTLKKRPAIEATKAN